MGSIAKTLDEILPKPPKENLNTHFVLGEIIEHIPQVASEFPGVKVLLLQKHLWEIRNKNVDPNDHIRGFLRVFEDTPIFKDALSKLEPGTQAQIKTFIAGGKEEEVLAAGGQGGAFFLPPSPAVKHHFTGLAGKLEENVEELFHIHHHDENVPPTGHANGVNIVHTNGEANGLVERAKVAGSTAGYPRVFEDKAETKTMEVHGSVEFDNWGRSVKNKPKWTFVPATVLGLQNLIVWAKAHNFRVRCGGYRHSWSSTFSEDNQVLVSLLNLEAVMAMPDAMSISAEHIDPAIELKTIQIVERTGDITLGEGKALCRIGVSVTNEQFRRWAVKNDKWTLPVDVILVEVTIGGVNGPICHGAGRRHQTVNDYVRAVEYIDCNGVHQTITNPAHLKAAAGCFGLLGIVTHITFELEPMSYAILKPSKPDIGLAIAPLKREDIPIALRKTYTDAQYAAALVDFKKRANEDYYSEWFWFTRDQQAWVNTWNSVSDPVGSVDYPGDFGTWFQWVEGWLGGVICASPIFGAFPGRWQAAILATFGMVALPPFEFLGFKQTTPKAIKCQMPNALHFRRGIQNSVVRDMEFQIPIPALASDPTQPDYSIVQRAWWDIINLCYEDDDCPMRLTLELRIMADSNLILAPQNGNNFGTASIEVISIPDAVADNEWVPFLQRVADLWLSYKDSEGRPLNVRPHWAKEWESINMRGMPSRTYLKEVAYRDAIPEWKRVVAEIGGQQGWGLDEIKSRFSNELWDYMIYS